MGQIGPVVIISLKNAERTRGIVIPMLIAKLVSSAVWTIAQVVFHIQDMTAAIKVFMYNL